MKWCWLAGHDYNRIGPIVPIKSDSPFSSYHYLGHYALGKCVDCGNTALQECEGRFKFSDHEMLTKEEYLRTYGEVKP